MPTPLLAAQAPRAPRHARRRRAAIAGLVVAVAASGALVVGTSAAVTAATVGPLPILESAAEPEAAIAGVDAEASAPTDPSPAPPPPPLPAATEAIPTAPPVEVVARELCATEALTTALAGTDDSAVIAAAGGAAAFHTAVVTGAAPCITLDDPDRVWFVVNKQRPYSPIDARPSELVELSGIRTSTEATLQPDAAAALSAMVAAARDEGAGEIGVESAFRSFETQQTTYGSQVSARGVDGADLVSARPGHSEHQSGLAVDAVACGDVCGALDELAGTPQGAWIAANSWRFGWIVRYEDGYTPVTGYSPEPWHLRYVGAELATLYVEGGWHTLEEFWGLPSAPGYAP